MATCVNFFFFKHSMHTYLRPLYIVTVNSKNQIFKLHHNEYKYHKIISKFNYHRVHSPWIVFIK